jgi:hypothetical protein
LSAVRQVLARRSPADVGAPQPRSRVLYAVSITCRFALTNDDHHNDAVPDLPHGEPAKQAIPPRTAPPAEQPAAPSAEQVPAPPTEAPTLSAAPASPAQQPTAPPVETLAGVSGPGFLPPGGYPPPPWGGFAAPSGAGPGFLPPSGYPPPPWGGFAAPSGAGPGYPGGPAGWASAPPPLKRSHTGLVFGIVGAVALVLIACLGVSAVKGLRDAARTAHADSTASADPTENDPAAAPAHSGDIEQYVMKRPAAAHTWPKVKAGQPLDLKAAAATFTNPDRGELVLHRYDFKDGYQRRWVDEDGNYIIVLVFRFTTTDDGADFAAYYEKSNAASSWGEPQTVPGVPGGTAFAKQKPAANGLQETLAMARRGDIVAVVNAAELPPAGTAAPDKVLATEVGLL